MLLEGRENWWNRVTDGIGNILVGEVVVGDGVEIIVSINHT